jgi:hypothetical protein
MGAIVSLATTLLFLGLFFWAINALSVLRNQMDEVLERLERLDGAATHRSPPTVT